MKFLLISLEYYPSTSGGARRPESMVHGLRELGHDVDVATPYESTADIHLPHPVIGKSLAANNTLAPRAHIPKFLEAAYQSLRYWPDNEIDWAQAALKKIQDEADIDQYDCVLTTSPPESINYIGYALKKRKADLRWIADFRDSWLVNPLMRSRHLFYRRTLERRIGAKWLKKADLIVGSRPDILEEMSTFAPQVRTLHIEQSAVALGKTKTVINSNLWPFESDEDTVLVHLGSFLNSDYRRSIRPLLEQFSVALRERPHLRLALYGNLTFDERKLANKTAGCHYFGNVSRSVAWHLMSRADGLVLANAPNVLSVPGKLAEYIMAKKPIIFLGSIPKLVKSHIEKYQLSPSEQMIAVADENLVPPNVAQPSPATLAKSLLGALTTSTD
ncbi:MAG: hypothetical protein AAF296_02275 [Pseudomonadota bacterium]